MTLAERLNRISPKICRLVARKNRGQNPMSHSDVAKASGLARCTVIAISKLDRWDTLPLSSICAFSRACGVDLLNQRGSMLIATRWKMGFMRNATGRQRKMYERLLTPSQM